MANRGDIKAGSAYILLGLKQGDLIKGLKAAEARLKSFGDGLTSIGMKMFAAGGAILAPMLAATHAFTNAGDAAAKMAQRTGMIATEITKLTFAAEANGIAIGDVEAGFRKWQKTLGTTTLLGMSADDQFSALADTLAAIEDPTERAQEAMRLFGKSGTALLPMLAGGAEGLAKLKQQAVDLGVAMDADAIQSAIEMDSALGAMKGSVTGLGRSIGSELAPLIIEVAKVTTSAVVSFGKFIREHGDMIRSVAKGAAAVVAGGAAALALGKMFLMASSAVAFLSPAILFLATPLGAVTALVIGGAAAWLKWSDSGKNAAYSIGAKLTAIRDYFGTLFGDIGDIFGTTWNAIVDAVSGGDLALAGEVAMAGLTAAWHRGTAEISKLWSDTKWYFLTIWGEAHANIGKMFSATLGAMEKAWVSTAAFFKTVWNDVTMFVESTRLSWGKSIGDAIISAAEKSGAVTKEFAATWRDTLKNQTVQNQQANAAAGADFQAQTEAEAKKRTDEINARTAGVLSILDADRAKEQAAIDAARAATLADKQRALDEAKANLAELSGKATTIAASKRPGIGGGLGAEDELGKRSAKVTGTFFSAALAGMGGGPAERLEKLTEKHANWTKEILAVQREALAEYRKTRMAFSP